MWRQLGDAAEATSPLAAKHLRLDPLDRSRSHPELYRNLQDTPVPLGQRLPDARLGAGGDLRSTEGFAIGVGTLEPALTRLTIIDRSNWAKTPHIWNMASPVPQRRGA